jgi:hypothetical protein
MPYVTGNFAIRRRCPIGDASDLCPNCSLEGRAAHVQRQIELVPGAGKVLAQLKKGGSQCAGALARRVWINVLGKPREQTFWLSGA